MIPRISEHDTWISLDPIIGCPTSCEYCFVRQYGQVGVEPTIRFSPQRALAVLGAYLESDPAKVAFQGRRCGPQIRLVCLGNHTDMLMTSTSRQYALEYASLHAKQFPEIPLVLVSKGQVPGGFARELGALMHPILFFVTQSFLRESTLAHLERGVSSPEQSLRSLEALSSHESIRALHYWRPLTEDNLPDVEVGADQLRRIRDAGAVASVAVGLKHGPFLRDYLSERSTELTLALEGYDPNEWTQDECFPADRRQRATTAGAMVDHPVYFNTSCAVSFALGLGDLLETWRHPASKARCITANCPSVQRSRCSQAPSVPEPTENDRAELAASIGLPPSSVTWDKSREALAISSCLDQDTQNRIVHSTGWRSDGAIVGRTLEWIGSLGTADTSSRAVREPFLGAADASEGLRHAIRRMKCISGLVSPFAPGQERKGALFSRYKHVKRVASVAVATAWQAVDRGASLSLERTALLGWAHDANRWPLAHISEEGRFDQASDLVATAAEGCWGLSERDIAELSGIIDKQRSRLSIEGRVVLAADQITGAIEDTLLSISALGLSPSRVPQWAGAAMELPLDDLRFRSILWNLRYLAKEDPDAFSPTFDRIVTGYALHTIQRDCTDWTRFTLRQSRYDKVMAVNAGFLRPLLFPLINGRVGRGDALRRRLVAPLVTALGSRIGETFRTLDDRGAFLLGLELGVIGNEDVERLLPDFDLIEKDEPSLAFTAGDLG